MLGWASPSAQRAEICLLKKLTRAAGWGPEDLDRYVWSLGKLRLDDLSRDEVRAPIEFLQS
jgi:hypothetical protein